jgi:hypothetical protein
MKSFSSLSFPSRGSTPGTHHQRPHSTTYTHTRTPHRWAVKREEEIWGGKKTFFTSSFLALKYIFIWFVSFFLPFPFLSHSHQSSSFSGPPRLKSAAQRYSVRESLCRDIYVRTVVESRNGNGREKNLSDFDLSGLPSSLSVPSDSTSFHPCGAWLRFRLETTNTDGGGHVPL